MENRFKIRRPNLHAGRFNGLVNPVLVWTDLLRIKRSGNGKPVYDRCKSNRALLRILYVGVLSCVFEGVVLLGVLYVAVVGLVQGVVLLGVLYVTVVGVFQGVVLLRVLYVTVVGVVQGVV